MKSVSREQNRVGQPLVAWPTPYVVQNRRRREERNARETEIGRQTEGNPGAQLS
jgi:hypothetical protein